MVASFRTAGTPYYSGGTAVTVSATQTVPAGVVPADWVQLTVSWVGTAGETAPTITPSGTGWVTVMASRTENNSGWAILAKTGLTAGDTFTYAVSGAARFLTSTHDYYQDCGGFGTPGTVTGRAGVSIATCTAASCTTTQPSQLVNVVSMERTTATGTVVSSVSPATTQRDFTEGGSCSVYVGDFAGPTTAGATSARTVTYNSASGNGAAVQIPVLASAAPTPTLTRATQGLPGPDRIRVAALSAGVATGARLAVSTSSGMTSPTYGSSQVPDAQGYSKHEVTGLAADTDYWWQVELDGTLVGTVGRAHTLPAVGTAASFSFLAASCSFTGSTHAVFTAMRTRTGPGGRRPLFLGHMGDLHYAHSGGGSAPNDQADHRTNYESALQSSAQAPLYRDVPLDHVWSDNDYCGSNSDGTAVGRPAAVAVRRQVLADPTLPDTGGLGLWHSWVVGRVRFIRTDSRTYMSDRFSVDNSAKSMLGTEQKAWLKAQLTAPQPVKVWLHDNAWGGTTVSSSSGVDTWQVFTTERAELRDYILANGVTGRLLYVHGDAHRLSADDGTNNPYGGFAVVGAAPMDQNAQQSQPVTVQQSYPLAGTADITPAQLYGWFDVTDTGGPTIAVAFTGYDSGGTQRVAMTTTVPVGTGLPLETDAPLAATRRHSRTGALPAETDTAMPAARQHGRSTGLPVQAAAVMPVTRAKLRTSGLPIETEVVLPAARRKVRGAGLPVQTSAPLPASDPGQQVIATGLPVEADAALAAGRRKSRAGALVVEADGPLAAARRHIRSAGLPTTTTAALPTGRARSRTGGLPGALEVPLPAARQKTRAAGAPQEATTALRPASVVAAPIPGRLTAGATPASRLEASAR